MTTVRNASQEGELPSRRRGPARGSEPAVKRLPKNSSAMLLLALRQCEELQCAMLKNAGVTSPPSDTVSSKDMLNSEYSHEVGNTLSSLLKTLSHAQAISTCTSENASDVSDWSSDDEQIASVSEGNRRNDLASCSVGHVLPDLITEPSSTEMLLHKKKSPDADLAQTAPVPTAYKGETEIAISRIFDLGKFNSVQDTSIPAHAPYHGPSTITMSGFGELGRWGNQLLQYIFMKSYVTNHNIAKIQVPGWVGAALFGLSDDPVRRALPSAVEFRGTLANSTFTTELIDYVKKASSGYDVPELTPDVLSESAGGGRAPKNVDMWGWFQWHTSFFAPFKTVIQKCLTPVSALSEELGTTFNRSVRNRGGKRRTVVGLHMRLGDYQNIAASSFGYCAPTSWYLRWLERIWPTIENPVLFVASDDIQAVLRDFAHYEPLTADSIGLKVPESMSGLKAGFFPDWYALTQCDVLAISNSTFSFTACMMNQRPEARFFRAHYNGCMEEIDPWNADPVVHRDMNKGGVMQVLETVQIVYNTQGSKGVAKNLFYELPYYAIRSAVMKAVLWRQARINAISATA